MYQMIIYTALTNALLATLLAVSTWFIYRLSRNSQIASILWIVVFLKFLTPPVFELPMIPSLESTQVTEMESSEENPINESDIDNVPGKTPKESLHTQKPLNLEELYSGPEENSQTPDQQGTPDELAFNKPFLTKKEMTTESDPDTSNLPSIISFKEIFSFRTASFLWISGSVLFLVVMVMRGRQFHLMIQQLKVFEPALQKKTDELAVQIGLKKSPAVYLIPAAISPMIWSFSLRPMILIPEELYRNADDEKLGMILAHELAHLRRKDHKFRWIELSVLVLFWWFPVVRWIRKEWHAVQEKCCDEWVIRLFPERRVAYGEMLLEATQYLQFNKSLIWSNELGSPNSLKERIETMLERKNSSQISRSLKYALIMILGPMLAFTVGEVKEAPVVNNASGILSFTIDNEIIPNETQRIVKEMFPHVENVDNGAIFDELISPDKEKQAEVSNSIRKQLTQFPESKVSEKILTTLLEALNSEKAEARLTAAEILGSYVEVYGNNRTQFRTSRKIHRNILDSLIIRMNEDSEPMMKFIVAYHLKNIEMEACSEKMLDTFYNGEGLDVYYSLGLMQSMAAPWEFIQDQLVSASRRNNKQDVDFWKQLSLKLVNLGSKNEITPEEFEAAFHFAAKSSKNNSTKISEAVARRDYFRQEIIEIMTLALVLNSRDLTEAFLDIAKDGNEEQVLLIKRVFELGLGTNKFYRQMIITDEILDQALAMIDSENKVTREIAAMILKHQLSMRKIQKKSQNIDGLNLIVPAPVIYQKLQEQQVPSNSQLVPEKKVKKELQVFPLIDKFINR